MKLLMIISFFLLCSCNIRKEPKNTTTFSSDLNILKIICSKSPNDICIEMDNLGNLKYANSNYNNNLNPLNGLVDSYYEGVVDKKRLKSVINLYQEVKKECLINLDSNTTYLGISEAYCIIYYANSRKEIFKSISPNKSCWKFIEELFKLVQKKNLKLNENTYYFESAKQLLPHKN